MKKIKNIFCVWGCSCIMLCFAFVFVSGVSSVIFAADAPPEGSYKKTCKNIYYNKDSDNITSAFCKKMDGKWNTTQFFNVKNCTNQGGDISNCDGTLECTGVNLPSGSYKNSCWCCRMVGDSLRCYCKPKKGKEKPTTLNNASGCTSDGGDISNCDGTLECTSVNLPSGSYKNSCWCCGMVGDSLRCYCKPMEGKEKPTTLNNASGCTSDGGDISNCDGTLRCTGVNLPNVGSYKNSCWCCRMEGSDLSCYCKPKKGKEKFTTLKNATYYSDIWNDNGTLKGK